MKRILITQSNYIPWKGYFDSINLADQVILYDDAKFTKRDWRNRNQIKTAQGIHWLSIPVEVKGKFFQKIRDVKVSEPNWNEKHLKTLMHAYAKAPHFKEIKEFIGFVYERATMRYLSEINYWFLTEIGKWMGFKTNYEFSDKFIFTDENPTQKLIDICKQANADEYLSGPTAQSYLEENKFSQNGIKLTYLDFQGYPEYPQLYPPFTHHVSILDLLFNCGSSFQTFMKTSIGHDAR